MVKAYERTMPPFSQQIKICPIPTMPAPISAKGAALLEDRRPVWEGDKGWKGEGRRGLIQEEGRRG